MVNIGVSDAAHIVDLKKSIKSMSYNPSFTVMAVLTVNDHKLK